jgi:hypothetical protein
LCIVSGIKIPRYPTDGKIRHPVRSLKPHRRGPGKTNPSKALTACQSLEARKTTSIPLEPCRKVSGEIGVSGGIFPPRPSPHDVIKSAQPPRRTSASPEGHVKPSGKTGSHESPQPSVADPESFLWVGTQYRNSAPQYATVLATVLRYLGHRKSGVVLGLPKTWLGPPLPTAALTPADGTDVTVHSQQEHGNHALTQHDPIHSTTITSIPLQRRGNNHYTT